MACGILVPQPGVKPAPFALEAQSFNHWTTGEVHWPSSNEQLWQSGGKNVFQVHSVLGDT